jgi:hypothetical protein
LRAMQISDGITSAPWAHYILMKAYNDRPFTLGIVL